MDMWHLFPAMQGRVQIYYKTVDRVKQHIILTEHFVSNYYQI